jgi:hypothetical protein
VLSLLARTPCNMLQLGCHLPTGFVVAFLSGALLTKLPEAFTCNTDAGICISPKD